MMGQAEVAPKRAAPSSFAALMLGHSAQGLAFTAFAPALTAIAQDYKASGHGALIAQLTVSIASAGVIVGALVSGWVIARLGARATVLAALAVYALAGSGGMFLTNAGLLLASRTVVGFATACLVTACISTIAARYAPHERGRVIGAASGAGSVAALVGVTLGGALAQNFGWRMAFAQYPVFGAAGLVLAASAFPSAPASQVGETTGARRRGAGAWNLWPIYLLSSVIAAVMFVGSTQFPFMLGLDGFKTATSVGLAMGAITLTGSVVAIFYGVLERRLGLQGALTLAMAAVSGSLLLIGLVRSPAAAVLGAALQGVYVGVAVPYLHHVVTLQAAPAARPRAIGLVSAFNFFGALVNPILFAPISAALGIPGLFVVLGVATALLAAGALSLALRGPRAFSAEADVGSA